MSVENFARAAKRSPPRKYDIKYTEAWDVVVKWTGYQGGDVTII